MGRFNGKVRVANESYAQKMNINYYYHSFLRVYFNLIRCIVRDYTFNCTFMYVRSQKFGYIGHWLSDVSTLEMKNF